MINVHHELADSRASYCEALRLLSIGGTLLVADWRPGDTGRGPSQAVRASADEISAILSAVGFCEIATMTACRTHAAHRAQVSRVWNRDSRPLDPAACLDAHPRKEHHMSDSLRVAVPSNGAGGIDAPARPTSATPTRSPSSTWPMAHRRRRGPGQPAARARWMRRDGCAACKPGCRGRNRRRHGRRPSLGDEPPRHRGLPRRPVPHPRAAVEAYLAGGLTPFGGSHVCSGH